MEIQIPYLVGKFELDCDRFAFKAGEGVIFEYEKNFRTHQSTVSVGIGLKLELQASAGHVEAGAPASVGESFFICFDGNNKISDGGLKFDVKAAAGIESDIPGPVKVKTDTDIGYTMGINSGWNFNEGPFK